MMLESSIKQFRYYKQLVDKSIDQVHEEVLFHRFHEDDNSIAVIMQHLVGNMASRWTHVLEEDGEKSWRQRDKEFVPFLLKKADLLKEWERGWQILFNTLDTLTNNDLERIIYIRNEGMSLSDAIIRQMCHYSYHCGQIVYKCKQMRLDEWTSLSIPKNKSAAYNFKKFEQIQEDKHFLDDLLEASK